MASDVARTGQAKSEHRIRPRAARYRGVCPWIAVWTERGRARVLGSFDLVGNSAHSVVREGHHDLPQGYSVSRQSSAHFRVRCRRFSFWDAPCL